jgi:DNA-directed RNA polymerase subunit RPC12/RpoP
MAHLYAVAFCEKCGKEFTIKYVGNFSIDETATNFPRTAYATCPHCGVFNVLHENAIRPAYLDRAPDPSV